MLLSILKKWHTSQQFYSVNVDSQQLYVFAMNNKAYPPSTNTSKKCRSLFPHFRESLSWRTYSNSSYDLKFRFSFLYCCVSCQVADLLNE
jgi:hypothetical protein